MGYIESSLLRDEMILHRTYVHWAVMIPVTFVLGVSALALFGAMVGSSSREAKGGAILFFLLCLAVFVLAWLGRACTEIALTNRRVVAKTGVISRHTIEMNLAKIENMSITQGFLGGIFGYGSVMIVGTGGTREWLRNIEDPDKFHRAVQDQAMPGTAPASAAEAPVAPPTAPPAIASRRASAAAPAPIAAQEDDGDDDDLLAGHAPVSEIKITAKLPNGKHKVFTLRSTSPGKDIPRALKKLKLQGCTVLDVGSE